MATYSDTQNGSGNTTYPNTFSGLQAQGIARPPRPDEDEDPNNPKPSGATAATKTPSPGNGLPAYSNDSSTPSSGSPNPDWASSESSTDKGMGTPPPANLNALAPNPDTQAPTNAAKPTINGPTGASWMDANGVEQNGATPPTGVVYRPSEALLAGGTRTAQGDASNPLRGYVSAQGGTFGDPTANDPNSPTYDPNRALDMGATGNDPAGISNALKSGNQEAIAHAVRNLTGQMSTSSGAGKLFDSGTAGGYNNSSFAGLPDATKAQIAAGITGRSDYAANKAAYDQQIIDLGLKPGKMSANAQQAGTERNPLYAQAQKAGFAVGGDGKVYDHGSLVGDINDPNFKMPKGSWQTADNGYKADGTFTPEAQAQADALKKQREAGGPPPKDMRHFDPNDVQATDTGGMIPLGNDARLNGLKADTDPTAKGDAATGNFDVTDYLKKQLAAPTPYDDPTSMALFKRQSEDIQDKFDVQDRGLKDWAMSHGLGESSIYGGNQRSLNVDRRSAMEDLNSEMMKQRAASTQQGQMGWLDRLTGAGNTAFNQDLQTQQQNTTQQELYLKQLQAMLGA